MHRKRWVRIVRALGIFVLLLTGCFGGSSSPGSKPPGAKPLVIKGTVFGPASLALALGQPPEGRLLGRSTDDGARRGALALLHNIDKVLKGQRVFAAADSLAGETPLAGVPIHAYDLNRFLTDDTNAPVLANATTKADGSYELALADIAPGTDILLIVGTDPRLSAIVPGAAQNDTANVNSATTLAAEAWAHKLSRDNGSISSALLEPTVDAARSGLRDMNEDELANALAELLPDRFGDGFPADPPGPLADLVRALLASMPEGPIACSSLDFPTTSARPTTVLPLTGIAPDWADEDTFAWLQFEDGEEPVDAYIELIGGDEAEIVMPIHPVHRMDGGDAQLVVHNELEGVTCPPIAVHIESLTPAPGTLADVIDGLHDALATRARAFGFTAQQLLASEPDELPLHVRGLAAGLRMIEGDDVPNNMRRVLADGALTLGAETFTFDADDLELVDALLAADGFADRLGAVFAEFQHVPAPTMTSVSAPSTAPVRLLQEGIVMPENIRTPEQLAYWMDIQAGCAEANRSDDLAKQALVSGSLIVSGLALIPGPASPAAALAGFSLAIMQINLDMCENLLPSTLTDMQLRHVEKIEYDEDDGLDGMWQAALNVGRGRWTLDWPTVVGLIPGAGKVAGAIGKATKQTAAALQFGEAFAGWMQDMLTTAWQHNDGPLDLRGTNVRPIDVDPYRPKERDYFNWRVHALTEPDAFELNPADERFYTPLAAGVSELQIETEVGAFQNEYVSVRQQLEVKAIEIDIAEDETERTSPFYVLPGSEITLHAEVQNALNKTVEWSADGGTFFDELQNPAIYTAPDTPGVYSVTASSRTRNGPRANNDPPRFDTVSVVVGKLDVSSAPGCVEVGDSFQFVASMGDEPIDFSELIVVVDGPGTLALDGTFTATGEGFVTVRVWHPDYEGVDEVVIEFEVKQDCTGFTARASGDATFTYDGSCTAYGASETDVFVGLGETLSPIVVWFQTDPAEQSADFAALRDGVVDSITQWFSADHSQARMQAFEFGVLDHLGFPRAVPLEGTLTIWGHWNSADEFRLDGEFDGMALWQQRNETGELEDKSAVVRVEFRGAGAFADGHGTCHLG